MKIVNNEQYKEALHNVYNLMNKGEDNITDAGARLIKAIAQAIEFYEDNVLKLMPLPLNINGNFILGAI